MSIWSKHAIFEKNSIILIIGVLIVISIGGLLFLLGALIMVYNLYMTVRGAKPVKVAIPGPAMAAAE